MSKLKRKKDLEWVTRARHQDLRGCARIPIEEQLIYYCSLTSNEFKMNETQFREMLRSKINERVPKEYNVDSGKSILYKLIINAEGNLQPENYKEPKRGQYAFQTDILISREDVPLVVIETKVGGFSTHDVLTYSTKALRHKEVYPYLKYGLIIGGQSTIDRKFFIHNSGFDFAIAVKSINDDIDTIMNIINAQIKAAKIISNILRKQVNLPKVYSTYIELSS